MIGQPLLQLSEQRKNPAFILPSFKKSNRAQSSDRVGLRHLLDEMDFVSDVFIIVDSLVMGRTTRDNLHPALWTALFLTLS